MSLPPYFNPIYDQDFGSVLTGDNVLMALMEPIITQDYYRPWRQQSSTPSDVGSIKNDKDKVQITLDVQHFSIEDIAVKIVDDHVVIEGKHDEKQDENGFISREFRRRYKFPVGCDPEAVECKFSTDGVLTVTIPRHKEASTNERNVPIAQTGPVRKESKDQVSQATDNGE